MLHKLCIRNTQLQLWPVNYSSQPPSSPSHLTHPLHPPTSPSNFTSHFTLPSYPSTLPLHLPTSPSHVTLPPDPSTSPSHLIVPPHTPTSHSHPTLPPHPPTSHSIHQEALTAQYPEARRVGSPEFNTQVADVFVRFQVYLLGTSQCLCSLN